MAQGAEGERHLLGCQIAELEEQIRTVKTRQNTLTPIGGIPEELLSNIFSECLGEWPTDGDYYKTLLAITHVCARWRSTALANACLWAFLDLAMGAEFGKTFLERSQKVPISLKSVVEETEELASEEQEFLHAVLRDPRKLRRLTFKIPGREFDEMLPYLLEGMPVLTHFSFYNDSNEEFALPTPLFSNHAPRLETLSLHNVQISWTAPVFNGLTSLSLVMDDGYWHNERPLPQVFFNALCQAPALQHLVLDAVLPARSSFDSSTIKNTLHLNSLQTLKITGNCHVLSALWAHIRMPSTTQLIFSLFDVYDSDLRELLQTLRLFPIAGGPPSSTATACTGMQIHGDRQVSLYDAQQTVLFELNILNPWWTPSRLQLLLGVVQLEQIRYFGISATELVRADALAMALEQLLWIEEFHVYRHLNSTVFDIMRTPG